MTQLHVDLPADVSERVANEVVRRGVAPEELLVEVVAQHFSPRRLGIIGIGTSGCSDISEHVDEEIASRPRPVIVCDTGPLYAAADFSDAHHDEYSDLLNGLSRPLIVPISVVVATSYLIEHRLGPLAEARFLAEIAGSDFHVEQLSPEDLRRAAELIGQYADLPLGALDASVIAVAERLGASEIATLDRRHSSIVRAAHVGALTLLP